MVSLFFILVFIFFFDHAVWHVESQFHDLNHWKSPACFLFVHFRPAGSSPLCEVPLVAARARGGYWPAAVCSPWGDCSGGAQARGHRLWQWRFLASSRLNSCGAQAQLLCSVWDPPRSEVEFVSPALADGLPTTEPPGDPRPAYFYFNHFSRFGALCKSGFQNVYF